MACQVYRQGPSSGLTCEQTIRCKLVNGVLNNFPAASRTREIVAASNSRLFSSSISSFIDRGLPNCTMYQTFHPVWFDDYALLSLISQEKTQA